MLLLKNSCHKHLINKITLKNIPVASVSWALGWLGHATYISFILQIALQGCPSTFILWMRNTKFREIDLFIRVDDRDIAKPNYRSESFSHMPRKFNKGVTN